MVTSLVGSNSFLLNSTLKAKRSAFVQTYGDLAVETVDVADWEVRRVMDAASALPFLSPKRLLIMRGLAANKPASDRIEDLLALVDDSTELIIVEPKIDKRSVLYKTLKKQSQLTEFAEGDARSLPSWLVAEAKARGGSIKLADATYLVGRIGALQQMLSSELDKLLLYSPQVTRQTIDALTDQTPQSSIFDLIDAAFNGKVKAALALYDDQRAQNVEPLAIEALFVWQLQAIALCKAGHGLSPDHIAAQSGISPYVAKKSAVLAARRSLAQIRTYVHELADLEQSLKSTSADADELIKNYIVLLGS